MKLILINGPSRSGKDTIQSLIPGYKEKLSWPLKMGVLGMIAPHGELTFNELENHKEEPFIEFRGLPLSFRRAQIDLYEKLSEVYGGAWLTELLVHRLKQAGSHINEYCHGLVTVSDSGRPEECAPIVKFLGAENVFVLSVTRPGVDWSDNRRPVDLRHMGVGYARVENNSTVEQLAAKVENALYDNGFWPNVPDYNN